MFWGRFSTPPNICLPQQMFARPVLILLAFATLPLCINALNSNSTIQFITLTPHVTCARTPTAHIRQVTAKLNQTHRQYDAWRPSRSHPTAPFTCTIPDVTQTIARFRERCRVIVQGSGSLNDDCWEEHRLFALLEGEVSMS